MSCGQKKTSQVGESIHVRHDTIPSHRQGTFTLFLSSMLVLCQPGRGSCTLQENRFLIHPHRYSTPSDFGTHPLRLSAGPTNVVRPEPCLPNMGKSGEVLREIYDGAYIQTSEFNQRKLERRRSNMKIEGYRVFYTP